MNSLRPETLPVKSKWDCLVVYITSFLICIQAWAAPLIADDSVIENSLGGMSDIFPLQDKGPAQDLLLKKEDEKKADALTAFILGFIAEDNSETDKALREYQKVIDIDPGYAALAMKVAFELARRGEVSKGINILKDSISSSPKNPLPYLGLSQLYAKYFQKTDLAVKYALQSLDLDPKNFAAYLAVYDLYINSEQPKKAEQLLERASRSSNDDPQFWLQLAGLSMRTLVKNEGANSAENLKKVNGLFEKALLHGNNDLNILSKVADYYLITQQAKEAISLYLKIIDLKSNPADPAFAYVRHKLAIAYRTLGQPAEAIKVLEKFIEENPSQRETHELLGQLFEENKDLENAVAQYQKSLEIDPEQPLNYLRVSELLLKSKKFDKAVDVLVKARLKFPHLPQITYSLAVVLTQTKRQQEAVTIFEEALHEAEKSQKEMVDGAFYLNYGAALEQAGQPTKAAEFFKKSIQLDPDNAAQAYNYLGFMWVDRGENLEEAGAYIRRALELDPSNGAYIDSLGWLYYKKGDLEKALVELLKAAESITEEDPVVYDHIGDTYFKLGDTVQALVYWQKAAALDTADKKILEKIEDTKQKMTLRPSGEANSSSEQ